MEINQYQYDLLKSRYIQSGAFSIGRIVFDCWEGEWTVTNNHEHIDVFTFRRYKDRELKALLNAWGIDTSKLTGKQTYIQ
jgi:hypothetical protein